MSVDVFWTGVYNDLIIITCSVGLLAVAACVIAWQSIVRNKLLLKRKR